MKLIIRQLDRLFDQMPPAELILRPSQGWIKTIRTALEMTNTQLARKLGITPQSAIEIERREAEGSITLKTLREAADKLDMELIYWLKPKDGSLEALVNKKSNELAKEIVMRTAQTMKLEDQAISKNRIKDAIKERADQIKQQSLKKLWD